MGKKSTPLKDEQVFNVDDLYQKLDEVLQAVKELADQKSSGSEQQNSTSEGDKTVTTENFSACFKKGYQVLRNGYVIEEKGLLFDQDLENIGETFKTKYDEFTEDLITKGNENRDVEKKRLAGVYDAHEVRTMKQMEDGHQNTPFLYVAGCAGSARTSSMMTSQRKTCMRHSGL